ncbi:MAG: LolA family protein [Bacteroidales bacterium]
MKLRTIFSLFIFSISFTLFAVQQNQKGVQILDKARETYEKAGSVSAEFSVTIFQKSKPVSTQSGSIKMKGSKFRVMTDEAEVWFDGKNQWVLPIGTEEVSLSAPSETELDAVNPSSLFQIYNKGFRCNFAGLKVVNGKSVNIIDLIPIKPKQGIDKITLNIDEKSSILSLIFIQNKNGNHQKINITNYKSGLNYNDNLFVFNKKQYPNVEFVDVR